MTQREKVLVLILRVLGISGLFALVAIFMPLSWMVAIHRWLGMGEMPTDPVVEYLARSLSAFYALFGALDLVLASDLERYRPLVRLLAVAVVLMSVIFTGINLAAGMPWWWTAFYDLPGIGLGVVIYWLAGTEREKEIDHPQERFDTNP